MPAQTTTAASPHCHICDLVKSGEGLVHADGSFSAFTLANRPGWILYGSNLHADWLWGLDDAEASGLGPFLRRVSTALRDATGASHVYYVGLGENSLHFHGMLCARYVPFASDVQAALARHGADLADADEAARLESELKDRLASPS